MNGDLMIASIRKAFSAYTSNPFLFMWGSFAYLFMFLVFLLAAVGLGLIYFMVVSALQLEIPLESPITIFVGVIITLAFLYCAGGINAALAKTYYSAASDIKTSLLDFYHYALSRAPYMFGVMLMREFFTILLVGPVAAIYYYFFMEYQYMDYLLYLYAIAIVFILHMLFTPALISVSLGSLPFDAFRTMFFTVKKKHLNFLGMYILFAIVWVLNFVPLIQLITIFFLYPVVYTGMVFLVKESPEGIAEIRPKKGR
jgi:hypothetical protein